MTPENRYIEEISNLLNNNNIAYEIDGNYINILNSSSNTRIVIKKVNEKDKRFENCCNVAIEEFDKNGKTTYFSYFVLWKSKTFVKRLTKNIG